MVHDGEDELVVAADAELLRLPRTPDAVARQAALVRALPVLRTRLPVAVPVPRYVGVLADGATPFTAERAQPGEPLGDADLSAIAVGQLAGLLAGLRAVPEREAQTWGIAGRGTLLHGDLGPATVLVRGGLVSGVVGWRLRLGDPDVDLARLPPAVREALG